LPARLGSAGAHDATSDPTASFQFKLSPPRDEHGAPKPWLPGTSSNWGPPGEDSSAPDYIFEQTPATGGGYAINPAPLGAPSSDGLTIATTDPVDIETMIPVTVTSHDFGGSAWLSGTATIQGRDYDIQIVDSNGQPVTPPSDSATGSCGTAYAQHPFASLPVDQDCNGIADSWEGQYTNPPGGHLDPSADIDGPPGQTGDGFCNFDEYRGFHYVTDDWNESAPNQAQIQWTSTDPTQKDVFFWDTSSDGSFTTALRSVLAVQAPFNYRRVSQALANPVGGSLPTGAALKDAVVKHINKNSPFVETVYSFALVYVDPGATLYPTPKAGEPCGVLATAQHNVNDGVPILVYSGLFSGCAAAVHNFPVDVLTAGIIAHETGHKFTLGHYGNTMGYESGVSYPAAGLTLGQYVLYLQSPEPAGVTANTLARYNTYQSWTGLTTQDRMVMDYDLEGNAVVGNPKLVGSAGTFDSILQYAWKNDIVPNRGGIPVARQFGYIMDWAPRLAQQQPVTDGTPNLRDPAGWLFWPGPSARPAELGGASVLPAADLPQICVKPKCN